MGRSTGRTRVLWLAKGLGPGGMERLLVNHARFGDRDRFDYHAAYLIDRPNSVIAELEELQVECVRLGGGSSSGLDPRWLGSLRRLVRDRGIDIVHTHSPMPAAMSRPLLRVLRPRPKLVYTEHNTWDCYGQTTRLFNLATYSLDDHQFAVSAEAAASPPSRLARSVEVLTHGVDLDSVRSWRRDREDARRDLGVTGDQVVIICVANLRREKGYDVLLDAASVVLQGHDDVVFLSVGHGQLEHELRGQHDRLGLGERFRFLGFRDDALRLMAASDVFTLGSRQEGLPLAFMEAMALGLPAVVTAVGGLPDVVTDGVNGVLVPPESSGALAGALSAVVGDATLRKRLSSGATEASQRFDARRAVQRQEAVYRELVG